MMPEMDGISAAWEIKSNEETKSIPLVMISGLGHEQSERLSQEHGIEAYIYKPFSVHDVRDVVGKLLNSGK
jgi:CheY-like chemotaxis protein